MKFKCIKNKAPGLLMGFDHSEAFSVGEEYTAIFQHFNIYVYSRIKAQWVHVYTTEFFAMFVPTEQKDAC